MSGFGNPGTTFPAGAPIVLNGGSNTSGLTAPSTTTPSSGSPFTPSATTDSFLLVPIVATTTGTVTITVGGVTYVPVSNLVALSEPTFTLPVRAGQSVTITTTGTTVVIGTCTIVPH